MVLENVGHLQVGNRRRQNSKLEAVRWMILKAQRPLEGQQSAPTVDRFPGTALVQVVQRLNQVYSRLRRRRRDP